MSPRRVPVAVFLAAWAAGALGAGCSSNDEPAPSAPGTTPYFQRLTSTTVGESAPDFAPDSRRVAYERGDEIWVLDVTTRVATRVAARGNHPSWSGDGSALLFVRRDLPGGGPLHRLVRLHLETGVIDTVSADTVDAYEPAAAPSGNAVALRILSRNDTRQTLRLIAGGDDTPLTEPGTWVDTWPAWSRDATRIAFVRIADTGATRLYRITSDGDEEPAPLTGELSGLEGPAWDPDGTRLFVSQAGTIGVIDAAGGPIDEFVRDEGFALSPTVSPDRRRLVFATNRAGNFELWQLVDPNGLGAGPYAF